MQITMPKMEVKNDLAFGQKLVILPDQFNDAI